MVAIERFNYLKNTFVHSLSLWLNYFMSAKLILRNEEIEIKHGMTLRIALQKINVMPETVLAIRNGELITDDEIIREGDVIKLVAVISGG